MKHRKLYRHLFREIPPKEFVEEILRYCGFESAFSDRRFVTKVGLHSGIRTQEQWLPYLEPYYLPCKAERFFGLEAGAFTVNRLVTVLRHILRQYDYDLVTTEVADHGAKQSLYQIQPVLLHLEGSADRHPDMEVTFD